MEEPDCVSWLMPTLRFLSVRDGIESSRNLQGFLWHTWTLSTIITSIMVWIGELNHGYCGIFPAAWSYPLCQSAAAYILEPCPLQKGVWWRVNGCLRFKKMMVVLWRSRRNKWLDAVEQIRRYARCTKGWGSRQAQRFIRLSCKVQGLGVRIEEKKPFV